MLKKLENPPHIGKYLDSTKEITPLFIISYNVDQVVELARKTKNSKRLKILADYPNYSVTMRVAENLRTRKNTLHKIVIENPNVPPVLDIVQENPNCGKRTFAAIQRISSANRQRIEESISKRSK